MEFLFFLAAFAAPDRAALSMPAQLPPANQQKESELQRRFAAYGSLLERKSRVQKKMYAACLIHQGKEKAALEFIGKELSPDEQDIVLLSTYYELSKKFDPKSTNAILLKLADKVEVKPFASQLMVDQARRFLTTEQTISRDCYRKAIEYNPLEPGAYFELARITRDRRESFDLCASALLIVQPESEISARILDLLEKKAAEKKEK